MASNSAALNRIQQLLDEASFLELGAGLISREADVLIQTAGGESDGVVTGYGTIDGRPVYIYAQNPDVMGGSLGEMHSKKIQRIYRLAKKSNTPVIGLIDCSGVRISEGPETLNSVGKIYKAKSQLRGVVPQISIVFGNCGGSIAVMASMCDFLIAADSAKIYMNPATVREFTGVRSGIAKFLESNPAEENADLIADDSSVFEYVRRLYTYLPLSNKDKLPEEECFDDLNRICELELGANNEDILMEIADEDSYIEVGANKTKDATTAFIRLNGRVIGAAANNDQKLSAEACCKMAEFIEFCDNFNIPVLTITNANGFSAKAGQEVALPGAASKLAEVIAAASVPKINLITGDSVGSAYVLMNCKGIGGDFVFAWQGSRVQIIDETVAAKILSGQGVSLDEVEEKAAEYTQKNGTSSFIARGYVDKVIDPCYSRLVIAGAFEMLYKM